MNTTSHTLQSRCTAQCHVDTPLGPMLLARSADGLAGAWFEGQKHHPGELDAPERSNDPLLQRAAAQLQRYFAGGTATFDLPLDAVGTAFQRAVWAALTLIPPGATRSYGDIARLIGSPQAVRAVGAAVGRNPLSLIVPCHRVVGSSGALTGYAGGIERKRALLALEQRIAAPPAGRGVKGADLAELTGLAALWGASFLFMRLGAAEFGPVVLAALRVIGATLCLLPLLRVRGQWPELRRHWRPIFIVGITNSALPFLCFSYAALSITAGLSSIFNAATPLFGALIAWAWLKDRPTPPRIVGLAIGFAGVVWLAWDKASFKPGGSGWAVLACLAATLLYGVSASFTKRHLVGVAPLAVATGSQLAAALALALPAWWWWPAAQPSATAWWAATGLALLCTALAYVMYFRLIARIGPANAIAVTFLIPVFAVLWGWLLLAEGVTGSMVLGCAVILVGTGLATGVLRWPARR